MQKITMRRMSWSMLFLLRLLWAPATGQAHGSNASFTDITIMPSRIQVVHLVATEDLDAHFSRGGDRGEGTVPPAVEALAFLRDHLTLTVDGEAAQADDSSSRPRSSGAYSRFELHYRLEHLPATIGFDADPAYFDRFGPQHTNFVTLDVNGRRVFYWTIPRR